MKTVVFTQVYEIRESAKGWSAPLFFYFDRSKAEECLSYCKQWAAEHHDQRHFQIVVRKCEDSVIYNAD